MSELIEIKETQERVILAAVQTGSGEDAKSCLEELGELVKTAGAAVAGTVIQNREHIHPGTYLR